ncbi:MAG: 4-hydroxythreonine-4-phosphate dehydrogenase PdxA [Hyphomicrobiaceae bacterium]
MIGSNPGSSGLGPAARLPLALTMGEPAGISAEISLKAWMELRQSGLAFFFVGSSVHIERAARALRVETPIAKISAPAEALSVFSHALPVIDIDVAAETISGQPSRKTAGSVIESIRTCVEFVRSGHAAALVTNPIQKAVLQEAGFAHPGHTEFLQELAGPGYRSTMMLVGHDLRVVPVTVHQSLRTAISQLTTEMIVSTALDTASALASDFGLSAPRLAIAGLNPHAGEGGMMGNEETEIIEPAIRELCKAGLTVAGPMPPDTMFTCRARSSYDAAICMYHDQALIPLKTLDMDGGVNVTVGLPFVRTSPDHGTALDIAGKGVAEPGSLMAALRLAAEIADRRRKDSR